MNSMCNASNMAAMNQVAAMSIGPKPPLWLPGHDEAMPNGLNSVTDGVAKKF